MLLDNCKLLLAFWDLLYVSWFLALSIWNLLLLAKTRFLSLAVDLHVNFWNRSVCFLYFWSSLVDILASGSGSDVPHQDIVTGKAGGWLRNATLRFFSLAEQCNTQSFYLRCFKSDFDAVKSKFGLLTKQIEKTTSKWRWPQKEDDQRD